MNLSDQEKLCLAKAINNNGQLTPGIIKSVYSSSVDVKSKFQTFEAKGLVRKTDRPALFKLIVEEDEKGLKWKLPREVKEMADNIKKSKTSAEEQEKLLQKYSGQQ